MKPNNRLVKGSTKLRKYEKKNKHITKSYFWESLQVKYYLNYQVMRFKVIFCEHVSLIFNDSKIQNFNDF